MSVQLISQCFWSSGGGGGRKGGIHELLKSCLADSKSTKSTVFTFLEKNKKLQCRIQAVFKVYVAANIFSDFLGGGGARKPSPL